MSSQKETGSGTRQPSGTELSQGAAAHLGAMAGGIAHDLNTVITTVYGYSEQALESLGKDNPDTERYIRKIIGAADRAKMLTGQLLALSRRAAEERVPVRVAAVLAETIDFITPSVPSGVRISRIFNAPEATILAVPAQLFRIFLNLLLNAAQAISDMEGTIAVTTDGPYNEDGEIDRENGNRLQILISDTGTGMDSETASRVFEPYFTSSRLGGTGLGLTVVSDAVMELGGTIRVESAKGKGTTIGLMIPVAFFGSLH